MKISLNKIKTINIYHLVIWLILILFKLTVDYAIFGNFLLLTNLKAFLVFIALFYANYCLFLPFLIKQNSVTRIAIIAAILVVYGSLFVFFIPNHPPFPPKNFPPPPRNIPFDPGINFRDIVFKIGLFSAIFSTLISLSISGSRTKKELKLWNTKDNRANWKYWESRSILTFSSMRWTAFIPSQSPNRRIHQRWFWFFPTSWGIF